MSNQPFTTNEYWRALILYGLNTATYKIALGQTLAQFVQQGKTSITQLELAEAFFDLYRLRLQNGKPQLVLAHRQTVMERIVTSYNLGQLTSTQAIEQVARDAFGDVLPRFHKLNNQPIPIQFYHQTSTGLLLTDQVHTVFTSDQSANHLQELNSRWDLLEAAFEMRRAAETSSLANDIRQFYLLNGYDRTDITGLIPVLNGYQNNVCFYCGEPLGLDIHVDHLIPRQLLQHDQIWNLVLAHGFCNEQKSDFLPPLYSVEKLITRNEFFIASNHPIREQLLQQLGPTPRDRRAFTVKTYDEAKIVIRITWPGVRGYDPATDIFYRNYIRSTLK
jgi:hypothetical protein